MSVVEFYFDFSSPNAYFSSVQLDRLSDRHEEVSVDWKPIFLGGIMKELETTPPAMQNEKKASYLMKDLERWGEEYDIPFSFPEEFPVDSLLALRAFLLLQDKEPDAVVSYARAVFHEAWANGRNIARQDVLEDSLPDGIGDSITLADGIARESVKEELKRRTDAAMERGVFGCPTFFVDDEMFWGKDRLDFVRRRLGLE